MTAKFSMEFENNFLDIQKELLSELVIAADKACIKRIALVGGCLRDAMISLTHDQPINKIEDIDLVIEGSEQQLAETISQNHKSRKVAIIRTNDSYKTIELEIDGIRVDVARARLENYSHPAENPNIIKASIEEDLYRRDFTINSIALDLRSKELIDPYQGIEAIKKRKIEFINEGSVEEDPTRIIRAARYSTRLNFQLSSSSINQIQTTLKIWPWKWCPENKPASSPPALATRLRKELELLFKQEDWPRCILLLQQWDALRLLDNKIQTDRFLIRQLFWGLRLGVSPITCLISGASNPHDLAERLQLPEKEKSLLKESHCIFKSYSSKDFLQEAKEWGAIQWCEEIESSHWKPDAIAITICAGSPVWKPLLRWWGRWRLIKAQPTAKELISEGWEEGVKLGQELKRLRYLELKKIESKNV